MTRTDGDMTGDGTRRFSVTEAAGILGISTEATRQRIKRGTLDTERDVDGNVFVLLNVDRTRTTDDGTNTNADRTVDGTDALASLIEGQQDQIEFLRQQLQAEREANRENRRLLAAALERIPAIEEAQPGPRGSDLSAPEERGDTDVPPEPDKPVSGWWRRLFCSG